MNNSILLSSSCRCV